MKQEAEGIAVIGMAGRFPGARSVAELWDNLAQGVEAIRFYTKEELAEAGIAPAALEQPAYVRASGYLEDADLFDPFFFGFTAREAEVIDPQHRLFLETAWTALEAAGYDAATYEGAIGVIGGMNASSYLFRNLLHNRQVRAEASPIELRVRNDKDFLTSIVAYKIGLTGPSFTVQSACSTSLVAVSLACQSLSTFQCDMALAGGVSVGSPMKSGFLGHGQLFGADGHCHAFDAAASGTPGGNGVGVVVLKRLEDALADGDRIRAVIRGYALNNDGALKVGYTAPSVAGQAAVVARAQAMAGIRPEQVGFIEAHGTGTPLGDLVEVTALTQVFRASTGDKGFCAIGSVKTNVGHLDAAAGVTSLIKTVLALEHGQIPPSLNFTQPNPNIDFANSPFFVNTHLIDWPRADGRRRAGVSAFAVGGMNAHLVLEEAPRQEPSGPASGPDTAPQLLVLSAKTDSALDAATGRLADSLARAPETSLSDAAYTLQVGRRAFGRRLALVCDSREDAAAALAARDPKRLLISARAVRNRPVFLLFPGLGEQYPDMGLGLYQEEPVFRREVDRCSEILAPHLGCDLRSVLYPRGTAAAPAPPGGGMDLRRLLRRPVEEREIDRTWLAQPAVFVVEYALACLWLELGIQPRGLAGFSLGEYVAACVADVFPLEDALRLVARRARLISDLPPGAMLAVSLPEEEVLSWLRPGLALAAASGAASSVLAGPEEEIAAAERELAARGATCLRLRTSHAFHSPAMEHVREATVELLREVDLAPPRIPFLSNVTGSWITDEQATDPEYWGGHLVGTVRFADNLAEMGREGGSLLVEVGPGQTLGALALQHPASHEGEGAVAVPSLRAEEDSRPDRALLLESVARLWLDGVEVSWEALHEGARRRRIELPTYPFERQRFWIEPDLDPAAPAAAAGVPPPAVQPALAAPARPAPAPAPSAGRPLHRRPDLSTPHVAPGSRLEASVAEVWEQILGLANLGVHDNFFALGGDSMLAPRLLLQLGQATGVELSLRSLFVAPTIAEMAQLIEQTQHGGRSEEAPPLDLAAEVVLDPEIAASGEPPADPGDPRAVFLTGATGFLGAFLAAELMARTDADLYCLVRAGSPREGAERIRRNLERHEVWDEAFAARIVAVPGDLGQPLLGLSAEEFDRLAARLDTVYHCGAWVNATYTYEAVKPANVVGTHEALRLAARTRTKPFHFVSTLAVFPSGALRDGVAYEDAELRATEEFITGYVTSKWVGEGLVGLARERGIPAAIFRPAAIGGHSRSGICNHQDFLWNMVKGCIQLGAGFEGVQTLDVAPVDYVGRAIVHLACRADSAGGQFHLVNHVCPSWRELFEMLRGLGYALDLLPYEPWYERLSAAARPDGDQALIPFLSIVPSPAAVRAATTGSRAPADRHDDANTRRGLTGSGIRCPAMDAELLGTYVAALVERGFLPPPAASPEDLMHGLASVAGR